MKKRILVLNAGSATLKFKLFNYEKLEKEASGICEKINLPGFFLTIDNKQIKVPGIKNHTQALREVLKNLNVSEDSIRLIGHRVVHGGEQFIKPTVVSKSVLRQLAQYNELAPLHNPINLAVIKTCFKALPKAKNIAVFDTAFFSTLTPENYLYALPYKFYSKLGVRRYGFHGISHKFVAKKAAEKLKKPLNRLNLITLHLGNGCSATAIKQGKPVATSMGFTPLAGLVMGTRAGDLDPAIPLYLQKKMKIGPDKMNEVLNRESGLLGLSQFSSDAREILKAAGYQVENYKGRPVFTTTQKKNARLALQIYIARLREYIAYYHSILGHTDAIVFTGGVGERSPAVRKMAIQSLKIRPRPKVIKIATDEELEIAQQIKK